MLVASSLSPLVDAPPSTLEGCQVDVEETGSEGPHPGHPLTELDGVRQKGKATAEEGLVRQHHQSVDVNLRKLQETVADRGTWHPAVHGVAKTWTQVRD